ncbi:MAG: GGDEF domain-containing protein [Lachnospiraceae bacterium]|nr:GGDEF domain-containing protein [Lachnospiraceae bacterium]
MNETILYYVEINVLCLIILSILLCSYSGGKRGQADGFWYKALICMIQLYCVCDIFAIVFKGKPGTGASVILWIANTMYLTLPMLMVLCWVEFTKIRTATDYKFSGWVLKFDKIVLTVGLITVALSLSSPVTHFAFTMDAENLYHRHIGAYLIAINCYWILFYVAMKMLIICRRGTTLEGRRFANVLFLFIFPSYIASFAQVLLYGSTIAQTGYTLSILIIHIGFLQVRISRDALTGLNNRKDYENMLDRLKRGKGGRALIVMVDVDHFKHINDTYGHMEGDNALCSVARILEQASIKCRTVSKFDIYRYGGDEFILFSTFFNEETAPSVTNEALEETRKQWNETGSAQYEIELSVGMAYGSFKNEPELKEIIAKADNDMYRVKAMRR